MKFIPFIVSPIVFSMIMALIIPKIRIIPGFLKKPLQQVIILGGLITAVISAGTLLGDDKTSLITMFVFAPIATIGISVWFVISIFIEKKKNANQGMDPTR